VLFLLPRGHGEGIELRRSVDSLGSVEQSFGGQNLNARIIFVVPELGTVAAGIGGNLRAVVDECVDMSRQRRPSSTCR